MTVYLIRNEEGQFKIGYTNRDVNKRLKELQTASPSKLEVLSQYETKIKKASLIEAVLHNRFAPYKINGEWFDLGVTDAINFRSTCERIEDNLIFLEKNKI